MSGTGWTTVRYGRGSSRKTSRGRGPRSFGRMDGAFPASGRRQAPFPYPNRRVPPSNQDFRGSRTRFDSYSSVVRQGRNRVTINPPTQDTRNQGLRRPADPPLRQLVRKLFSIIKVVHHLRNVATKQGQAEPRAISRTVEDLTLLIKPAFPNQQTSDLIMGNAKNWGYNTLLILEDHYNDVLQNILNDLSSNLSKDWRSAYQVATRWAFRNFARMTQDVIDHAEALIASCEDGPAAMRVTEEDQDQGDDHDDEQEVVQEVVPPPPPSLPARVQKRTQPPTQTDVTQSSRRTQRTQSSQSVTGISPTVVPTTQPKPKSATVATMTEPNRDWSISTEGDQTDGSPATSPQQSTPRAGRTQRQGDNNAVFFDVSELDDIVEESQQSTPILRQGGSRGQTLLDQDQGLRRDRTPPLVPGVTATTQPGNQASNAAIAQVHRGDESPTGPLLDLTDDSESSFTSTPDLTFRAKRHINTQRKLVDWDVTVTKKWLILGDSNVARFPTHSVPDLQIDSYPGGNFRHAGSIIEKALIHTQVDKLVLAFGINCRAQRARATSIKQLQSAVREAKKQFPTAEIWIPLINYSTLLSQGEQNTIQILNAHIKRNMPYIPLLPRDLFHTETDTIHWTRGTAKAMLEHWSSFLFWGSQ